MIENNPKIQISVRNLVDFVLSEGDLKSDFQLKGRALAGTKGHQKVQKSRPEEFDYKPEVSVSYLYLNDTFNIEIIGRIDGIYQANDPIIIEEIKTTTQEISKITENYNPLHWAQAICYGFIYCAEHNPEKVIIQLTYYQIDTEETIEFRKEFTYSALKDFFFSLVLKYAKWAQSLLNWQKNRDLSIMNLEFPYLNYREGQRKLAVATYNSIKNHTNLFVQAPTGIGKTIAVLFPAIKSIGTGFTKKIFYLTAKTIGRTVAEKAIDDMRKKGLSFKSITLTAKEKICINDEFICDPENCIYAKQYFVKVKNALNEWNNFSNFNRDTITEIAYKYEVCPFELSLDFSLWADCIICDYNYAFDPRVYLKRFFENSSDNYVFLIDEAHNFPDRARSMFSAEIEKKTVLDLKRSIKDDLPKTAKTLNKINSFLIKKRKEIEETDNKFLIENEVAKEFSKLITAFMRSAEKWLAMNEKSHFRSDLLNFYFECNNYMSVTEYFDTTHVSYFEKGKQNKLLAKLYCIDPAPLLSEALKRSISSVFFSATLQPIFYFQKIITAKEDNPGLILNSPFPHSNLSVLLDTSISTRYKQRENYYLIVAERIKEFINLNKGNYLIFFPSYAYMNRIKEIFEELYSEIQILVQQRSMNEEEREAFLDNFQETKENVTAFAVMGGIFGEGIDLIGNKLIGVGVVGVGLPMICLERDLIKDYFNNHNENGFEYAYQFPGMNRVMQAAGRLIRSETDKGALLLMDERFYEYRYKKLFPHEWKFFEQINDNEHMKDVLGRFWKKSPHP